MANIETPLVSIIIPCYNGATTIFEALRSALDQAYKNIEIIVIDDGSTDNSGSIVRELITSEPSVSLYTQENSGLSAARNYGLSYANGDFVVFLDADDKLKETYVSLALSYHQHNANATLVYSNMELFERETGILPLAPFQMRGFLRHNCIPAFAMVKTEQIRAIGGFDESVTLCEDWECWMHLLKVFGGEVYRIEEPQYFYRKRFEKDSILDKNAQIEVTLNEVRLYVFAKHQQLYVENNMSLPYLYDIEDKLKALQKKHYNKWYKKAFYKWFKSQEYKRLYT